MNVGPGPLSGGPTTTVQDLHNCAPVTAKKHFVDCYASKCAQSGEEEDVVDEARGR